MTVAAALASRFSCRAFLDRPVERATVEALVAAAAQAPSGSNLQPWHVDVVMGAARDALVAEIAGRLDELPAGEGEEWPVHPKGLVDPFRARRFRCGEMLYEAIAVPREDRAGRLAQFARNFRFFDAPVGVFLTIDEAMGPGQWADMGMYALAFMLAAEEAGLSTCAQESWGLFPKTLRRRLGLPDTRRIYCAIALGHADRDHPVNRWRTERAPPAEFARVHDRA